MLAIFQALEVLAESQMLVKLSTMTAFIYGPKTFTKDIGTRSQPTAVLASTFSVALLRSVYGSCPEIRSNRQSLPPLFVSVVVPKRGFTSSVLLDPWSWSCFFTSFSLVGQAVSRPLNHFWM